MNNFTPSNPYTSKIPSGTLTRVQLSQPSHVAIQWPNRSGGNVPSPVNKATSFLRQLFG